jgi:hypothetical protein
MNRGSLLKSLFSLSPYPHTKHQPELPEAPDRAQGDGSPQMVIIRSYPKRAVNEVGCVEQGRTNEPEIRCLSEKQMNHLIRDLVRRTIAVSWIQKLRWVLARLFACKACKNLGEPRMSARLSVDLTPREITRVETDTRRTSAAP